LTTNLTNHTNGLVIQSSRRRRLGDLGALGGENAYLCDRPGVEERSTTKSTKDTKDLESASRRSGPEAGDRVRVVREVRGLPCAAGAVEFFTTKDTKITKLKTAPSAQRAPEFLGVLGGESLSRRGRGSAMKGRAGWKPAVQGALA
jgi:hypothetical protein